MRAAIAIGVLLVSFSANASSLNVVKSFVEKVTGELPLHFSNREFASERQSMKPLPGDVMAYARFFWTVDDIEGVCEFLGQRSNIEMIDPVVNTLLVYPVMREDHPDHKEYMRIYHLIDAASEKIGEDIFCPEMYKLLGPNGSLMARALKINGLIEPKLLQKYELHIEDGILWSTRDYCERRYYLEPPANQEWHDATCEKAKQQKF